MDVLARVFLLILYASLTASVVALIVILIKKTLNYHLGARGHHALWFLVMIRLLIPIAPQSHFSMFNILSILSHNNLGVVRNINASSSFYFNYDFLRQREQTLNKKANIDNELATNDETIKKDEGSDSKNGVYKNADSKEKVKEKSWINFILKTASCIWITGVIAITITFMLITAKVMNKTMYLDEKLYPEIYFTLKKCKKKLKINRRIPIYICNGLKNPCIVGVINPKIYVSRGICEMEDNQLSHIFLHELTHYKRRDLVYNLLCTIAAMIHWFNPVVWFAVKKMKLDREFACDACVLEMLGEEEIEAYGMTLIKSSRLLSNAGKQLQLAIFFETKNQIKRRINMIKRFKKGSYKVTLAAVIFGVIAGSITLTNAVSVKNVNAETTISADANGVKKENRFLIDAPLKVYDNFKKVKAVIGYDFKLPDFMPEGYKFDNYFQVLKVSDNENALQIYVDNSRNKGIGYSIQIFKSNPVDVLKLSEKQRGAFNRGIGQGEVQPDFSEEPFKLGNLNGKNIIEKYALGDTQVTVKYFVWQSDGVWYSIYYDETYQKDQKSNKYINVSNEDLEKVVTSMKYPEEAKNIDYYKITEKELSTEVGVMEIYDKEDLQRAKELLGFSPKFPINLKCSDGAIKTRGSGVGIAYFSDIANKNITYELNTFYDLGKDYFTLNQCKTSKRYDDIKANGYITFDSEEKGKEPKKIKVETLNLGGKEVYKYENQYQEDSTEKVYIWKEDGYYCDLAFFTNGIKDLDEVVSKFVSEKPAE